MNISDKARKVVAKRNELKEQYPEGCCFLISVQNDSLNTVGGVVMQVPLENAAVHLVEGTHRFATEPEVKEWRDAQAAAARAIRSEDTLKRANVMVHVDQSGNPVAAQQEDKDKGKGGK